MACVSTHQGGRRADPCSNGPSGAKESPFLTNYYSKLLHVPQLGRKQGTSHGVWSCSFLSLVPCIRVERVIGGLHRLWRGHGELVSYLLFLLWYLQSSLVASLDHGHGFVHEDPSFRLLVPRCCHPKGSRCTSFCCTNRASDQSIRTIFNHENRRVQTTKPCFELSILASTSSVRDIPSVENVSFPTLLHLKRKESRSISSHSLRILLSMASATRRKTILDYQRERETEGAPGRTRLACVGLAVEQAREKVRERERESSSGSSSSLFLVFCCT